MTRHLVATTEEIETMLEAARLASEIVMRVRLTDYEVEMKGVDDPVTKADREANAAICDLLGLRFPEHGIVAEESAPESEDALRAVCSKERVFFVDPLDGTREFADRRDDFCVMIGLAVKGVAEAGVVALPVVDKIYFGVAGQGAFLCEQGAPPQALKVHEPASLAESRAVVSRSHMSGPTERILERIAPASSLRMGSVGVKAVQVISGAQDFYVHASAGAKKWDACAPDAIMTAAGGKLVDLRGHAIDYADPVLPVRHGMLAASAGLVKKILEKVGEDCGPFA
jgi:3'(2'), 5'-bisphosphate nucleotidase